MANPHTYGKALILFIKKSLEKKNHSFSFVVCEDFGWWLEVSQLDFTLGITACRSFEPAEEQTFIVALSREGPKNWSWKKFRFISIVEDLERLDSDLKELFENTNGIEIVSP